jgi:hypothetical protein
MTQTTIDKLAMTRAIERSAGHQYTFIDAEGRHGPFPGATSITALQDSLGGSGGLMGWAVGQAWESLSGRADALGSVLLDDEARSLAFQAMNTPASVGNAVHQAVDEFNRNLPLELNEVTAPYVAQYASALRREGIEVLSSEKYVVNVTIGFGGTYDSLIQKWNEDIGQFEVGPLDVKTGKEKKSQRLQLTGLSMGEWHGEAGLEPEPMPKMVGSVGWILLLRPDGYELIRHDITDADREHFVRLVKAYHQIRAWQEEA